MYSPPIFLMFQDTHHLHLYSLKDKKHHKLHLLQTLNTFRPVVSSHGWLAFSDDTGNYPFVLNPSSATRTHLPPKPGFIPEFYSSNIIKIVVSSQNPRAVIASYGFQNRLKFALCRFGDEKWSGFGGQDMVYYDVVCCDRTNTAFALGPGLSVESWDLNGVVPVKKTLIGRDCLELADSAYPPDFYATSCYLASSLGCVFLVLRYIEEFETHEGEVVQEADSPVELHPYKTVDFHVYKLDVDAKKWTEVRCLDDFAMILGGNHTTILSTIQYPELEKNAIYFTDDFWEKLDEDCFYGGHDNGIFRLENGSIEAILDSQEERESGSPPFWISLPPTYV